MFTDEVSTEVAVPLEQAFAWVTDLENIPKWQSGVFRSEILTPPPVRIGTRFRETFRVMGLRLTAECQVTTLTRPNAYGFVAEGPQMSYRSALLFEAIPGGTKITGRSTTAMRGLWRVLEPIVKAEGRREIKSEFARLKSAIEADHGVGMASGLDAGATPTLA